MNTGTIIRWLGAAVAIFCLICILSTAPEWFPGAEIVAIIAMIIGILAFCFAKKIWPEDAKKR